MISFVIWLDLLINFNGQKWERRERQYNGILLEDCISIRYESDLLLEVEEQEDRNSKENDGLLIFPSGSAVWLTIEEQLKEMKFRRRSQPEG